MKKIEEQKNKIKPNKKNVSKKSKTKTKKNESTNDFNFFDFLYQDEDAEYKIKTKEDEKVKEYINPKLLIEQLKKEEEEDTKILLKKLNSHKKVNKDFVKEMEKENTVKQRYNTKKNLMIQKKNDLKILNQKIIKDEKNIKRANKLDKKINSKVFQYFNDKDNNLDFNKKLNLQDNIYFENIDNVNCDIYKNMNQNKYIKSQSENKLKIEKRKKLEEERKQHLLKLERDNLRYQLLVKNNFKIGKSKPENNLKIFKEEKSIKGDNLLPNELNSNEQKKDLLSHKYEKTTKDDVKLRIKSGICQLPRVNDNLNFGAHDELNNILQKDLDKNKK